MDRLFQEQDFANDKIGGEILEKLFNGVDFMQPDFVNRLCYGDNLTIMGRMPNACVDLIYLDPPFNSQRTYNLIYKQATGLPVPEQAEAFCDAWEMDPQKEDAVRKMRFTLESEFGADENFVTFWVTWIEALRNTQPRLLAYLVYMTFRLFHMHRILKSTGSLYLHCDPTASHYIKVILDGVFGHGNFRSEIVWQRSYAHGGATKHNAVHDTIFFYSKGKKFTWNPQHQAYDPSYIESHWKQIDEKGRRYQLVAAHGSGQGPSRRFGERIVDPPPGRHWAWKQETIDQMVEEGRIVFTRTGMPRNKRYLDESPGKPITDVWTDIPPINSQAEERLGYPTQKPKALLERIIRSSSNEGDVIFDPFCGCGTAIYAAHKLARKWIGCDIAILSVRMVRDVLKKWYGLDEGADYEVSGVPLSVDGARELFLDDPHQFQNWAVELAGGFCSNRRSGDKGVDGRIHFDTPDGLKNMVISVKGGKLTPAYVRELIGTLDARQGSVLGGLICLNDPTKGMREAAATKGMWSHLGHEYPLVQIRTAEDLLDKRSFETPSRVETMDWERQTKLPF